MDSPILITGCGRSGASMIAGILQICGVYIGEALPPVDKDGRGVNENNRIHSMVCDYLKSLQMDPTGQYPLPSTRGMSIPTDWQARAEECIRSNGYRKGQWLYKSTKTCLMWPVWHYAFPNAKWLIVRRRTGDIVYSCMRTVFTSRTFEDPALRKTIGINNEREGWLWWVHQHERRFVEMIMEGLNCKVIWPHRMIYGDFQQIYETIEWLGLKWRTEVLSFIDPKLWKARNLDRESEVTK